MGFRLFKQTYTDRKGKNREADKWGVEFRDQRDQLRRLAAFTSKAASEELGRNLVRLVEYHKATGGQVDPALHRWLTTLTERMCDKLVDIGLLERERVAVSKRLADHLADWTAALTAKGNSTFHVEVVTARAQRIIDDCGFKHLADIKASKVQAFLNDLRADTDSKRGISAQTFNFYLSALKQFCRWMVKDRRATENPVSHLDGLNVKTDRRRDRRALTVDELVKMLDTAQQGSDRHGMTGPERETLYRLAVETGLRAGELRSLTRASFDLDADPTTVTVEAAYSKHRRQDTIPLRPELAETLRSFLATKAPAAPVFRIPTSRKLAARMFRADVEAAGIAYRDESGRVADFHCLRHTFITNLANGGVHPKVAQALARHSTITLTMDRYSHTLVEEQSQALESLPDLSAAIRQGAKATGTDGKSLSNCLPTRQRQAASRGVPGRRSKEDTVESASAVKDEISVEKKPFGSVCTSGGGPGLQNQWTA
jgi:integrase